MAIACAVGRLGEATQRAGSVDGALRSGTAGEDLSRTPAGHRQRPVRLLAGCSGVYLGGASLYEGRVHARGLPGTGWAVLSRPSLRQRCTPPRPAGSSWAPIRLRCDGTHRSC